MDLSRREVLRRAGAFAIAAPLTSLVRSRPHGASQDGAVLTVGAIAPATAADPVAGFDGIVIGLFQQVNEYLIWLEPDLTLSPQLATSWEPDGDAARWIVTLRPGVTFSD